MDPGGGGGGGGGDGDFDTKGDCQNYSTAMAYNVSIGQKLSTYACHLDLHEACTCTPHKHNNVR